MKKLFLLAILLVGFILPAISFAQTVKWHLCRAATVGWDAVTQLDTNPPTPIPTGNSVKYSVFIKDKVSGAVTPVTASPIVETQYEIVFTPAHTSQYYAGIKALQYDSAGTFLNESSYTWSELAASCADVTGDGVGDPFGFVYGTMPSDLRLQ